MHLIDLFLQHIGELSTYDLQVSDLFQKEENTLIVRKDNWDYNKALDFQLKSVEFIQKNNQFAIFIFTSHPNCFTVGKGLQRSMIEEGNLTEFDSELEKDLTIPLHNISRGGGITFHQPGQVVFYPILNINFYKIKIMDFIYLILEKTKMTIESLWEIENLDDKHPLIGLWHNDCKIASVGLHLKKFVTCHGLALNLWKDEIIWKEIFKVHPCGINPNRYKSIEDLSLSESKDQIENKRELFIQHFCEDLFHALSSNSNELR